MTATRLNGCALLQSPVGTVDASAMTREHSGVNTTHRWHTSNGTFAKKILSRRSVPRALESQLDKSTRCYNMQIVQVNQVLGDRGGHEDGRVYAQ